MVDALAFWDRVELWLVTLPFTLQLVVMLAVGLPFALLAAVVLQRVGDVLVAVSRRWADGGADGTEQEMT